MNWLLQDQGECAACVGFASTAALEASVNVYKQQSWSKISLSEQDFNFCKYVQVVACVVGTACEYQLLLLLLLLPRS
jgi:hypothetical protein